jgi:hypothetical protein
MPEQPNPFVFVPTSIHPKSEMLRNLYGAFVSERGRWMSLDERRPGRGITRAVGRLDKDIALLHSIIEGILYSAPVERAYPDDIEGLCEKMGGKLAQTISERVGIEAGDPVEVESSSIGRLRTAWQWDFPRLLDLIGLILPRSIRTAAYVPHGEELKEEYIEARRRYRTRWARRWIIVAFTVRTVAIVLDCLRVWLGDRGLRVLKWIVVLTMGEQAAIRIGWVISEILRKN